MDDIQGMDREDENDAITYTLESLAEFDDKALDAYFSLSDELFDRTNDVVNPVGGRNIGLQYVDFRNVGSYKAYQDYFGNFVSYLPSDEYLYVKEKKFSIFTGLLHGWQNGINSHELGKEIGDDVFFEPQFIGRKYNINGLMSLNPRKFGAMDEGICSPEYIKMDQEIRKVRNSTIQKLSLLKERFEEDMQIAYPRENSRYVRSDAGNYGCLFDMQRDEPMLLDIDDKGTGIKLTEYMYRAWKVEKDNHLCLLENIFEDMWSLYSLKVVDGQLLTTPRDIDTKNFFNMRDSSCVNKRIGHIWNNISPDDVISEFATDYPFLMDEFCCMKSSLEADIGCGWQCSKLLHRECWKKKLNEELDEFKEFINYVYGEESSNEFFSTPREFNKQTDDDDDRSRFNYSESTPYNPSAIEDQVDSDDETDLEGKMFGRHPFKRLVIEPQDLRFHLDLNTNKAHLSRHIMSITPEMFQRDGMQNGCKKKTDADLTFMINNNRFLLNPKFILQWEMPWQDWKSNPMLGVEFEDLERPFQRHHQEHFEQHGTDCWTCYHTRTELYDHAGAKVKDLVPIYQNHSKQIPYVLRRLPELQNNDNMWGNIWTNEMRRIRLDDLESQGFQTAILMDQSDNGKEQWKKDRWRENLGKCITSEEHVARKTKQTVFYNWKYLDQHMHNWKIRPSSYSAFQAQRIKFSQLCS